MKTIFILFCIVITTCTVAQNNIGIGTASPAPAAILDITANGKGVVIPRMDFANRPISPVTGLMIYQTDSLPGFYYYDGSIWERIIANEKNRSSDVESGPGNNVNDGIAIPFLSVTDTVQITKPGQKIFMIATMAFGTTVAGGANNLAIYPACQDTQLGSTIQTNGVGLQGLRCVQNERRTETVQYIFTGLTVGSYRVGMAGHSTVAGSGVNWNNNGSSYVSAFVLD